MCVCVCIHLRELFYLFSLCSQNKIDVRILNRFFFFDYTIIGINPSVLKKEKNNECLTSVFQPNKSFHYKYCIDFIENLVNVKEYKKEN